MRGVLRWLVLLVSVFLWQTTFGERCGPGDLTCCELCCNTFTTVNEGFVNACINGCRNEDCPEGDLGLLGCSFGGSFIVGDIISSQQNPTERCCTSAGAVESADQDVCDIALSPTNFPTPGLTITTPSPTNSTEPPTKSPTNFPTPGLTITTPSPTNSTEPPTRSPTNPTGFPTPGPTPSPSDPPTRTPTTFPTGFPTTSPTKFPSNFPTPNPTKFPSKFPTPSPTKNPTPSPTLGPSLSPSTHPTNSPILIPTKFPSTSPTSAPTETESNSSGVIAGVSSVLVLISLLGAFAFVRRNQARKSRARSVLDEDGEGKVISTASDGKAIYLDENDKRIANEPNLGANQQLSMPPVPPAFSLNKFTSRKTNPVSEEPGDNVLVGRESGSFAGRASIGSVFSRMSVGLGKFGRKAQISTGSVPTTTSSIRTETTGRDTFKSGTPSRPSMPSKPEMPRFLSQKSDKSEVSTAITPKFELPLASHEIKSSAAAAPRISKPEKPAVPSFMKSAGKNKKQTATVSKADADFDVIMGTKSPGKSTLPPTKKSADADFDDIMNTPTKPKSMKTPGSGIDIDKLLGSKSPQKNAANDKMAAILSSKNKAPRKPQSSAVPEGFTLNPFDVLQSGSKSASKTKRKSENKTKKTKLDDDDF